MTSKAREHHPFRYVLLKDVPRVLADVVAVHRATVYRWATVGIAGIKLQCVSIGGRRATTIEWLDAFFQAVEAAKEEKRARARPPQQRTKRHSESKHVTDTLKRFGIG